MPQTLSAENPVIPGNSALRSPGNRSTTASPQPWGRCFSTIPRPMSQYNRQAGRSAAEPQWKIARFNRNIVDSVESLKAKGDAACDDEISEGGVPMPPAGKIRNALLTIALQGNGPGDGDSKSLVGPSDARLDGDGIARPA